MAIHAHVCLQTHTLKLSPSNPQFFFFIISLYLKQTNKNNPDFSYTAQAGLELTISYLWFFSTEIASMSHHAGSPNYISYTFNTYLSTPRVRNPCLMG